MQESMARLQFRSSSFEKVLENHLEDWILEEKRFKDKNHTLIDAKPLKLRIIDGETNFQAPISLKSSMVF